MNKCWLSSRVPYLHLLLVGGEGHYEVLPGGVLQRHCEEVGPALGQRHGEDGGF